MADEEKPPTPTGPRAAHMADPLSVTQLEGLEAPPPLGLPETDRMSISRPSSSSLSRRPTEVIEPGESEEKWIYRLLSLRRRKKPPVPEERQPSRESDAGIFSRLVFHWVAPLMHVGYQRPLEANDIWLVNPKRSAEALGTRVGAAFRENVSRGSRQPLLRALFFVFKKEFLLGGLCQLTGTLTMSVSPYVLKYLIAFATDAFEAHRNGTAQPSISLGVGLAVAIAFMQIIVSFSMNWFMYLGMTVGGQSRAVLMTMIFDKALKISARARAGDTAAVPLAPIDPRVKPGSEEQRKWYEDTLRKVLPDKKKPPPQSVGTADGAGWSNGRIVNLMSTDTWRIDQASGMFHLCWTSPLAVIITAALLIVNLSYSALPGIGLLLLSTPILGRAIRALFKRRASVNKITDQRVSLTQEILQAVRFAKLFGWEMGFLQSINALRKKEIRSIQIILATRDGINAIGMSMPVFASMLSFITYALTNNILTPAPIFSSLALFNGLRMPLNFLPLVLGQAIDGYASIKRIQEFLLAEEGVEDLEYDSANDTAILLHDASFTWEKSQKQTVANDETRNSDISTPTAVGNDQPFQLHNINLNLHRGELVAIMGTVGSGKTSLLAALAGEMRKISGRVALGCEPTSRAYCPQSAWIQNASVRDNITFGRPFDEKWYAEVLDACALPPDLAALPDGDATEIGERGITLSGGQKARINVARAIYGKEAELVLLDDPLSAVDAHVGRHVMERAITVLLKGRTRVLATHQLHVLNQCDRVVWMVGGRVEAVGTYDELVAGNNEFAQLAASTSVGQNDEGEDDKDRDGDEGGESTPEKNEMAEKGPAAELMQAEERAVKAVSWGVYLAYLRASGSVLVAPLVFTLLVLSQGANICTSLWLSWWTSDEFGRGINFYIGVYAGLGGLQALFMFLFSVSVSVFGTRAGKAMLYKAMVRVLRAPMSFFDTTPLGRITNRFSKDIDVMDNNLTDAMRMFCIMIGMIFSIFILIISFYYYFVAALVPLVMIFLFSANYYRNSAREVKRHEAVLRSIVFAKFSEAVAGTSTIRAYGQQQQFSQTIRRAIDDMDSAYFLTFVNQRWLSIRLDAIGNIMVFIICMLVVTSRFSVNPSLGGLVLSYILGIAGMFQFAVRELAEVENNMNATERIHYYGTAVEQEAPIHVDNNLVGPAWPERGEIVFSEVRMRYRPGLPLVLKGVSIHVKPGERIGIIGRTGAGKSSIMSTLFRLVEVSGGSITIDGVNIARIGLHDLRPRMAIIPQDPTLFKGTVRSNLDPFNQYTDLQLWSALRQAGLVDEKEIPAGGQGRGGGCVGLDSVVDEEGLNFSLGQRQLMTLARALVRGSRIIVCDEATSSVDYATDQKVQRTIVEAFKGKTLLCIAHRLRTILSYDRICVMDRGRIAELGSPLEVFNQDGIFKSMCGRSGIRREDIIQAPTVGEAVFGSTDTEK